jgi:hypothetical protein
MANRSFVDSHQERFDGALENKGRCRPSKVQMEKRKHLAKTESVDLRNEV